MSGSLEVLVDKPETAEDDDVIASSTPEVTSSGTASRDAEELNLGVSTLLAANSNSTASSGEATKSVTTNGSRRIEIIDTQATPTHTATTTVRIAGICTSSSALKANVRYFQDEQCPKCRPNVM